MRLKIATTICLTAGLVLLAAWPFVMGANPDRSDRAGMRMYAIKASAYFSVLLLLFFAATLLAWLVVRQARNEYRARTRDNLKTLLEGTLHDHGKPKS